jgi:hypothetical protein
VLPRSTGEEIEPGAEPDIVVVLKAEARESGPLSGFHGDE